MCAWTPSSLTLTSLIRRSEKNHTEYPQARFEQSGSTELAGVHQQSAIVCTAQKHTAARILGQPFVVVAKRVFGRRVTHVEQIQAQAVEVFDVAHGINPDTQRLAHGIPGLEGVRFLASDLAIKRIHPYLYSMMINP